MAETPRTVVVVDDVADVRCLVRTRLELSGDFRVVGEASDGAEAVELAGRCRPDLLLLDVSMPRMDGLEALPLIKATAPDTQVVMFTGFDQQGLGARALELGAAGLIEKSVALDLLADQLATIGGAVDAPPSAGPGGTTITAPALAADELLLAEHLERFREVFEEAAIGMATVTLTGHVVRVNRALAALVARDVETLVGVPYRELSQTGAASVAYAFTAAQADGGSVVRFEHDVVLPSGQRWLSTTVAPVKDELGRPLYLFLQAQDVTAQRAIEEALRESEERYRFLVEAVQDYAIFMLGTDGRVQSWNAGAARINGYAGEEIIGQHFRVFYPADVQARHHPEEELYLAVRDGHYEEEGWRIRKDGSRFWASVVITAVHNGEGEHLGFAKVTRDIEERRRMLLDMDEPGVAAAVANAELQADNNRLRQAATDQAEFLAVTAHELRGPVSVLSGSAKLLVEHWARMTDAERDEMVGSISRSAQRLQRLLADLLTISRLESNAIALQLAEIDLSRLLASTVSAARAGSAATDLRLDVPPNLRIVADGGRLAQAVDNLIANALRHGRPPVCVSARSDGVRVEITVLDSGNGVAQDLQPRLFQRFATGVRPGGTGLGLFIVRELARAHGGDAWYLQPDGGGACFGLSIPAMPAGPDRLTDGRSSATSNQA